MSGWRASTGIATARPATSPRARPAAPTPCQPAGDLCGGLNEPLSHPTGCEAGKLAATQAPRTEGEGDSAREGGGGEQPQDRRRDARLQVCGEVVPEDRDDDGERDGQDRCAGDGDDEEGGRIGVILHDGNRHVVSQRADGEGDGEDGFEEPEHAERRRRVEAGEQRVREQGRERTERCGAREQGHVTQERRCRCCLGPHGRG